MGKLLSKAESCLFWQDFEMAKLKGLNLTPKHQRVLKHRIRRKVSEMIDLLSCRISWEYIQDPKQLFDMIDRLLNRVKENPEFGEQKLRDNLATMLQCYAFDIKSEEQREKRNLDVIKELKALRKW